MGRRIFRHSDRIASKADTHKTYTPARAHARLTETPPRHAQDPPGSVGRETTTRDAAMLHPREHQTTAGKSTLRTSNRRPHPRSTGQRSTGCERLPPCVSRPQECLVDRDVGLAVLRAVLCGCAGVVVLWKRGACCGELGGKFVDLVFRNGSSTTSTFFHSSAV